MNLVNCVANSKGKNMNETFYRKIQKRKKKVKHDRNEAGSSFNVQANLFSLQKHIFVLRMFESILCAKVNVSVNEMRRHSHSSFTHFSNSDTNFVFYFTLT